MYIGTNFPISSEYSPKIEKHIDAGSSPFDAFVQAGLDYVELAVKHDFLNTDALREDIAALQVRGLNINFHPYYQCNGFGTHTENKFIRANLETLFQTADEVSQRQGRAVLLNFHAASGNLPRETLLQHSHDFNHWLMDTVDRLNADVLITTEHQLPPGANSRYVRIGDRFNELKKMKREIPHERFGVCWDMGHSMMRAAHYDSPPYPPDDFPPLVRHVHIHDVVMQIPEDHRLIGTADSPLKDFIGLLPGYEGGFTMEYSADEFFGANYVDFLKQSRAALLELVTTELAEHEQ